eukprot:Polyplicarium_translucidae@DN3233_c0_g1_i1.p2
MLDYGICAHAVMLRARQLRAVLQKELNGNEQFRNVLVVTLDGGILAAGRKDADRTSWEATQAAAASIVSIYGEYGTLAANFQSILLKFEEGQAAVGALGSGAFVLVVLGCPSAHPGMLRAKFESLRNRLSGALQDLY